ncbi:Cd(II)/Pb(II)-responsive transcriptional regulator [Acerihabitans sp. TG2]|uniref:Cd(II)/Pb(II)-responsive transcriptional regulator n=1 Tax=Acerihabitans sp. TG2 TaxID=3096008 RepID=UPI002B23CFE8|nr:Cd(II)/Pb(II)-responsive transcriptional regulator [Acerihabitans sp. TG2]MEA9391863.1 Cd(II)/Pb(II)-responsive transcriptional regulator [Acerihabitans sp. TG2]
MRISQLAQLAHCTVETVRYYEKEGLLAAPLRTAANYRSYGDDHVERLRFIRNCRGLDMTHGEIRQLLSLMDQPDAGCGAVNQLLDEHVCHVEVRIAQLTRLKQQLTQLRQRCQQEQRMDACGILQGIVSMETEPTPEKHTHLG